MTMHRYLQIMWLFFFVFIIYEIASGRIRITHARSLSSVQLKARELKFDHPEILKAISYLKTALITITVGLIGAAMWPIGIPAFVMGIKRKS